MMKSRDRLARAACLLFICVTQNGLCQQTWTVDPTGSDVAGCGTDSETPCRSLPFVLDHVRNGDTVLLQGSFQNISDTQIVIDKSVTIIGKRQIAQLVGRKVLSTTRPIDMKDVYVMSTSRSYGATADASPILPRVVFENIHFAGLYLVVKDAVVSLVNCVLENSAVRTLRDCWSVGLHLENSTIRAQIFETLEDRELLDWSVLCQHLLVKIDNSTSSDVNLNFQGNLSAHLIISQSAFTKFLDLDTGIGGVNVSLPQHNGSVIVSDSSFTKQVHFDPIRSSINIESSALRIETNERIGDEPLKATVDIRDTKFSDNERGLSLSRSFKFIYIYRCSFMRNYVMHAAAAVRIAIDEGNKVIIRESIFDSNSAGYNKYEPIPGRFQIDGQTVILSDDHVNGIITLVGKGGALRIHRGVLLVEDCYFTNNTASLSGGAIYLGSNGTLELKRSYFENTNCNRHAMQGDILYSMGALYVSDNVFHVKTAMDYVSMLRHSGTPWSMYVKSLSLECPIGRRLAMINNTSHQVHPQVGLRGSDKLDQLFYFCENCGNNKYSTDRGYINYTAITEVDGFYTLLINGKPTQGARHIEYLHGDIKCHQCPYGGDCSDRIRAVANFWGYVSDDVIRFQHCPPNYCCSSMQCEGINSCASNRQGTLCGRCESGYSEALFSQSCIPNTECKEIWGVFIGSSAALGFLYMIFLMTQKEIKEFISNCSSLFKVFIRCYHQTKERCVQRLMRSWQTKPTEEPLTGGGQLNSDSTCMDVRLDNSHAECSSALNLAEDAGDISEHQKSTSSGVHNNGSLIILFYYFQDALLLHVETIYTKTTSKFTKDLKLFVLGLFRFRLDFFQFMDDICLMPDMQPVQKLLLKILFVPYVLILIAMVFLCYRIALHVRGHIRSNGKRKEPVENGSSHNGTITGSALHEKPDDQQTHSFSCRLVAGFTLAVLFTYQKLATATFTLLNCVPVGNVSVMFIDGTQECFQLWHYGIMLYAFVCVVPFSLVLMMGPPLLKRNSITVSDFFLGCIVPLPAIIYWILKHLKRTRITRNATPLKLSAESQVIITVLQGPFKESKSKLLIGQFCWAGVLVARRLILFLCYTFMNDILLRIISMSFACFVILIHHLYVKPYKVSSSNAAGAFSAAALLVVGTVNLLRASFEVAEYIPEGPYRVMMEVFEELENTLLLWLPFCGACIIVLACVIKIMTLLLAGCRRGCRAVLRGLCVTNNSGMSGVESNNRLRC